MAGGEVVRGAIIVIWLFGGAFSSALNRQPGLRRYERDPLRSAQSVRSPPPQTGDHPELFSTRGLAASPIFVIDPSVRKSSNLTGIVRYAYSDETFDAFGT